MTPTVRTLCALALACAASPALAQTTPDSAPPSDPEAGAPLQPREAPGTWTLSSKGGAICTVGLTAKADSRGVYAANVPQECRDAYAMASVTSWAPTADGMAFTDAGGAKVVAFSRWSNSLLVSKRSSGADLQLMRGAPSGD